MEFSNSGMKKAIKAETDKRVGKDAAQELGQELEEYGKTVAAMAIGVAEEDGRKTVRASDVKEALRRLDQ